MFRHPNYYKNLRKLARNREQHVRPISGSAASDTDQAISPMSDGSPRRRATGPGLKHQASSVKPQASEDTSDKHQAPSSKRQA
jgi:hypothetical protein